MTVEKQRDTIIGELDTLNKKVTRQNSIGFIFMTGIIYGVGFFIGSAIIATIFVGIFFPFFDSFSWIHETFSRGATLIHR